jgi:hypothetical protein
MNHEEQLILYVANQLDEKEKDNFEKHLIDCDACQKDLQLWNLVADEITASDTPLLASAHIVNASLEVIHQPFKMIRVARSAFQLLRIQLLLIQNELWLGSAILMFMFLSIAILVNRADVMYFFMPMIAAGTVSLIYGHEHDPAAELTLATPTSAWKILLARLTLVSGYNFLLSICSGLILLLITPPNLIFELVLGWSAPMMFLSALALLLSLWIGTGNALFTAYILWISQYVPMKIISEKFSSLRWLNAYYEFWQNPSLMFVMAFILIAVALWSANRPQVMWRKSASL